MQKISLDQWIDRFIGRLHELGHTCSRCYAASYSDRPEFQENPELAAEHDRQMWSWEC